MVIEFVMPVFAMGMNEGTVIEWLVQPGAHVERGKPLCIVETEKVAYDVESPETGWLQPLVEIGAAVPVDTPIARFAASEQEYRQLAAAAAAGPAGVAGAAGDATTGAGASAAAQAPAARSDSTEPPRASPLARKMAAEAGIDLARIPGSGPGGRIVERDVLAAKEAGAASAAAPPFAPAAGLTPRATVPLKGIRAAIARAMTRSLSEAAQVSHFTEADVTALMALREELARRAGGGAKISPNAFVIKAMALACRAVPIANASIVGDKIVLWDEVNIGIAIAVPGQTEWDSGLVVPVLRHADRKSLAEIDAEMRDLVARARAGQLAAGETDGGTITMSPTSALASNVYAWSTPILNLPQALIVQPGLAMDRPAVCEGQLVVRRLMPFSVTFDHRVLDGEPVGRFYETLNDGLLNPRTLAD